MYQRIVFCNCGSEIISNETRQKVESLLAKADVEKIRLNDLCGLCANNKDQIKSLFSSSDKTLLAACNQRAVKWLINYSGADFNENIEVLNLREDIEIKKLEAFINQVKADNTLSEIIEINSNPDWQAWYPVLDYERCTSCGQCADFCLFGVYTKQNNKVEVINPEGCKINCPACARICPQVAIVFPKYQHGGAISGTDSIDEVFEQKRQIEDMNQILGSDIYQALEQRKLKRQSIIRNEAMKKAMEERERALNEKNHVK